MAGVKRLKNPEDEHIDSTCDACVSIFVCLFIMASIFLGFVQSCVYLWFVVVGYHQAVNCFMALLTEPYYVPAKSPLSQLNVCVNLLKIDGHLIQMIFLLAYIN